MVDSMLSNRPPLLSLTAVQVVCEAVSCDHGGLQGLGLELGTRPLQLVVQRHDEAETHRHQHPQEKVDEGPDYDLINRK